MAFTRYLLFTMLFGTSCSVQGVSPAIARLAPAFFARSGQTHRYRKPAITAQYLHANTKSRVARIMLENTVTPGKKNLLAGYIETIFAAELMRRGYAPDMPSARGVFTALTASFSATWSAAVLKWRNL